MTRVVLMQCELEHRHQSPHLAMCLYARDLRRAGHQVSCALVHPSHLDQAADHFQDCCDLLVLDSIFPFALVSRLKESVNAIVLVGGHNALQHALRGDADLTLVGPGRAALNALAEAFARGTALQGLPGTWFRNREGQIDCGPPLPRARLNQELLPFEPDLDWLYFGPARAPGSNLRIPSIVAEFGCVYNRSTLKDQGLYRNTRPRLPDLPLTERAALLLSEQFISREGGCTFCSLRYSPHVAAANSVELLLTQARYLLGCGARGLSLQTEHPLALLHEFLEGLAAEPTLASACDELHIRTIPWLLLRHRKQLERAIEQCAGLGIHLHLGQVGFEAFDDHGLELFHKGLEATENRRAARLLGELSARYSEHFEGRRGHGLILLHPWSSPASLRENLDAIAADASWMLASIRPDSRVEFYGEWTPLFWKATDEGLTVAAPGRFGWDFRFADAECAEVVAVWSSILAGLPAGDSLLSSRVLDHTLRCYEQHPDPMARRLAYLEVREQLTGQLQPEARD
ncbi:MAG: hypothetical protein CMP23_10480 [Rickettsiales bacterium]|nr:hypothetical protein [Rickettsiales bacterium]